MSRSDLEALLRGMPAGEPPAGLLGEIVAGAPSRMTDLPASRRAPRLAAAAVLLLAAGLGSLLLPTRHGPPPDRRGETFAPADPGLQLEDPIATLAAAETALEPPYRSEGRRDPYVPQAAERPVPAPPPPRIADIELHATVQLPKDRYAVFLGADERCYTLREGDAVANGVLRTIDGDRVLFEAAAAAGRPGSPVVKHFVPSPGDAGADS